MKKILLAGSALVALSFAGAAHAQDASSDLKLSLGGYTEQFVGMADNDADGMENASGDVQGETAVSFSGEATLNNGMAVDVNIEFLTDADDDGDGGNSLKVRESNVALTGGFGKVILGSDEGVGQKFAYTGPEVGVGNGGEGGELGNWVLAPNDDFKTVGGTYQTWDRDADKLTYMSPEFNGLRLGGSYTPDFQSDNAGDNSLAEDDSDSWEVGATYVREVSGVTFGSDLSLNTMNMGEDKVKTVRGGVNVAYQGFSLGGSYAKFDDDSKTYDGQAYDLGISYTKDAMSFSVNYLVTEAENDIAIAGDDEVKSLMVSARYNLAPGVDALASVQHAEYNGEDGDDNKGWAAVTGIRLTF